MVLANGCSIKLKAFVFMQPLRYHSNKQQLTLREVKDLPIIVVEVRDLPIIVVEVTDLPIIVVTVKIYVRRHKVKLTGML